MLRLISGYLTAVRATVTVVCAAFIIAGCTGIEVSRYYDNGAVATSSPIATEIGRQVFVRGGNAFDVAVAVGFALAVSHPEAGNIGGGGFALIRDGSSGDIRALDFRETAPAAAYERMYLDDSGEVIEDLSTLGAKAAGVPGTVAGLYELWQAHGTLPWEELVGYAAALADTGFVVDQYLAGSLADHESGLRKFEETSRQYLPTGRAPGAGFSLVQQDLAKTLYLIAAEGRDGFYKGEIASLIDSTMRLRGGLITVQDLENYQPVWREPIHVEFDSLDVYSMPPPSSGGILVGQILKILEPFDFSRLSPNSPQFIHLFCEACRLAFADRSEHLGDPDFYDVPVAGLLDDAYIDERRALIVADHAVPSQEVRPGVIPRVESEQTTHFSVCDRQGNMVAITYTLNASYGSMLVVDGAGFLLNNEMDDFSVKPGFPNIYGLVGAEANKIEPNKRMLSSMSPTLILKDDRPYLAIGAPGGGKIITVVAQAILNLTRFDLTPTETAALPRVHHQWLPDVLYLEEGGFDINVKQALISLGHHIEERSPYSDVQLIYVDPDGSMTGASDPRKRGTTDGY